MTDLEIARSHLETGSYTCVVTRGKETFFATDRGVKPLLNWLDEGTDLTGASAADRVVGRGAAFLYCLLEVKEVHARVMSHPAQEVLQSHGIRTSADAYVPGIINRTGTGPCPFEAAVLEIRDAQAALIAIREKRRQMQAGN